VQQQHLLVRSLLGELRDNLEMAPNAHRARRGLLSSSSAAAFEKEGRVSVMEVLTRRWRRQRLSARDNSGAFPEVWQEAESTIGGVSLLRRQ
jgi:hypothetical protein